MDYIYDENGSVYGFVVDNTSKYYYTKNLQGDIIGIVNSQGTQTLVEYSYDAWGKATISYPNSESLSDSQKQARYLLGSNNPFRYRGYYFDNETGFYYLNSRYYDPITGRFINADNQISGIGGDISGYNLFAYCGNNPVNRVDPTGEAWWHWAIGAAIVVGFAAATVVTCGGSLAIAAASVGMVASGTAALTTATTVAAAGFIGSATVYGASVMLAASTSETVEEFCDKGNWGTVVSTAFGGVAGSYTGYKMAQTQISQPSVQGTQSNQSQEPFLPDGYYNKKAPLQATPNSSQIHYKYNEYTGKYEKSTTFYDFAGRQNIRIDWTNHGYLGHSNPHIHYRIYNSQYPFGKSIRWD